MNQLLPIILIALILAAGCSRRPADARLLHAAAISDSLPDSAAAIVAAIDPATLSGADRPFRDLLAVKAADKTYATHTSDSLILSVLAYAEAHPSCGFLPEARYYAGRVLSDLGDYPTALRHFQSALDVLPPS
ncbi:MAG: amino acid ABC transporter permease, partial [Muribaculaceae bacterium]|nr:amino acid ABC transporter permease [Muribaculaceae bacterium]